MSEVHHGLPVSSDDLLDFHLLLGRTDWLEELERELAERGERRRKA